MLNGSMRSAALTLALIGLAGPTLAQDVVLRLGHFDTATSPAGIYADAFAREVEALSSGTVKIEVFHASQLGGIPAQIAATLDGAQDMLAMSPEFMTSYLPDAKIVSAPYVFPTVQDLQRFYLSERWQESMALLAQLGAVPLDPTWSAMQMEPRGIITREPVITPADLEGVPTRIWESNVAIATWEGLGADTTVIPRGEFYIALSQGLASAGPETIGVAHAQRSVEVLKYWTRTDEYHQILNTWINAARYAELTDEQKGWLTAAAEAAGKEYTDFTAASYADTRALVREEFDVTVIEPAPQPWIEVGSAVLDKLVADGELTPEIVEYARSLQQ